MTTDQAPAAAEPWVWVPTVPGWIEVAAFASDEAAHAHWRDMVEPVREDVGDSHTAELYRMLGEVRSAVAGAPVRTAGLVVTWVEEELVVWTFATVVERVLSGDVNPVALVERGLRGAATSHEDVTFTDGRRGVLLLMDTQVPADRTSTGTSVGQCFVAVSLPDRPHDVLVVSAASTSPKGQDLLAMAAVSIADGTVVRTEPPEDAEDRGVLAGPGAEGPLRG